MRRSTNLQKVREDDKGVLVEYLCISESGDLKFERGF